MWVARSHCRPHFKCEPCWAIALHMARATVGEGEDRTPILFCNLWGHAVYTKMGSVKQDCQRKGEEEGYWGPTPSPIWDDED